MERTPALYRTRITHLRRAPVHHYFEHHGYSWYVDVDELPQPPRWVRPFATFDSDERQHIDDFLAQHGIDLRGGKITALVQARVLGSSFNPLCLYWCHDVGGALRHVVATVHTIRGRRHAYLLPPDGEMPVMVRKEVRASPFNGVDGYYLVCAPKPDSRLDVRVSLHREDQPALVATMRGSRLRAGFGPLLRLQMVAPLAPLLGALGFRVQVLVLRLRGVPLAPAVQGEHENTSCTAYFASSPPRSRLP